MTWNLTGVTDQGDYISLIIGINNLLNGFLGITFVLFIFAVCMIVFRDHEFKELLAGSSFITTILTALLWMSGIVSWKVLLFPTITLFISLLLLTWSKAQ